MFKNFLRYSWLWYILRWLCDGVRRHTISKLIIRYLCYGRATTSYGLIWDRTTSYDRRTIFVRHHTGRMSIAPLSYIPRNHSEAACHRMTIVRLAYDVVRFTYDSASHQAIIVKSYVIVRLSFEVLWCQTISQTLPMRRKPHRFEWPQNYDCDIVADVVARCDQCFSKLELYDIKISIHLQPCINIYKICYKL